MKTFLVLVAAGGVASAEPKIPQEVTVMGKLLTGNWKCAGTAVLGDASSVTLTGTLKVRVDLDGFWVRDTFDGKVGTKGNLRYEAFMSFDTKKWRRVMLENRGNQVIGTSDGIKDGKIDFNLDVIGGGTTYQAREHIDASDAKAGLKISAELSNDKGKTWNKVYEMTCKK